MSLEIESDGASVVFLCLEDKVTIISAVDCMSIIRSASECYLGAIIV